MAAESLEAAAKAAGHVMKVETQGSAGTTPLSAAEIAAADAVIFAHDLPVKDAGRFAGKPIVDVGVKKGISDGPALIEEAALIAAQWRAHPQLAAEAMSAGPAVQGGLSTKVDNDASALTKLTVSSRLPPSTTTTRVSAVAGRSSNNVVKTRSMCAASSRVGTTSKTRLLARSPAALAGASPESKRPVPWVAVAADDAMRPALARTLAEVEAAPHVVESAACVAFEAH
jgi:fructose-specific phosphotransferase system component IIB